jgi:hypothetical protein
MGLSVFLAAKDSRALCLAFFLMAVAGFIKQTLVAIPLSALVYLAIADRRLAIWMAIFGVAVCAALAALTIAIYSWNLIDQLLTPRQPSQLRPLKSLGRLQ